jgi:truncated hemoglobin YjbI
MSDSEALDAAKHCVAVRWCAGEMSDERFSEWLIFFERTQRSMFDRAIAEIVNEVHTYAGKKAA